MDIRVINQSLAALESDNAPEVLTVTATYTPLQRDVAYTNHGGSLCVGTQTPIDDRQYQDHFKDVEKKRQDGAKSRQDLKKADQARRSITALKGGAPPKKRGKEWGMKRYQDMIQISRMLLYEGQLEGGFLTPEMHELVGQLARKAINQCVEEHKHGDSAKWTASPPFWTLALAQEAFRRVNKNPDWTQTSTEQAAEPPIRRAYPISWDGLQDLYKYNLMGTLTDENEGGTYKSRKVVSHPLGASRIDMIAKMGYLHNLLIRAGDKDGLHPHIQLLKPMTVLRDPEPFCVQSGLQASKASVVAKHTTYGKKTPTCSEACDLEVTAEYVAQMNQRG